MPEEVIDDPSAATSAAAETTTDQTVEGAPEVTPASTGDPAETTPPAKSELDEFREEVARATGAEEPAKTPESETESAETEPEKTDEPGADKGGEGEETKDLSQPPKAEGENAPGKLTDRPEWQAITKIADRVGKEEGKQARSMLRELYKREYDLGQRVQQLEPAAQVVREMFQSVGGNEQGFNNMRHLIRSFDTDPATAVPMLKTLLADAEKRAGMVLQSPELVGEAQAIDQAVADGTMDKAAAAKRKAELLELEQARTGQKRTQAQSEAQRQADARTQAEARAKTAVVEIESAANAWEKEKMKSDPDYPALKSLHTSRTFQLAEAKVNQLGRMLTGAEARAIADEALAQVKAEVGRLLPKRPTRQAISGGGSGSSGTNRQTPTTELDEFKADVEAATKRYAR